MTNQSKKLAWRGCIAAVIALMVLTYSPLVLMSGADDPWLFGLPRTLWATLLTAFGIVVLTAIGAAIQPGDDQISDPAAAAPLEQQGIAEDQA